MLFQTKNTYTGVLLASLAALIWSGNFILARGLYQQISPISLGFYRWALATLILLPFAIKAVRTEWKSLKASFNILFWSAITGIAVFNTFIYIGAHYTSAINLALISTTSSPVISIILARIFLREPIGSTKLLGLIFCMAGVLFLVSGGQLQNLVHHSFSKGDLWVLGAAFSFATYNILVRKKPAAISPPAFLLSTFLLGTLCLLPFHLYEVTQHPPPVWNSKLLFGIAYLSIGASVICFLLWNVAIATLGAGRTALFGNLIPIFSSIEAVLFLGEQFTWIHVVSMLLVFTGIIIANLRLFR